MDEDLRRQINQLVDEYRDRCLWFLRADYYPTDLPDVPRTLDYIRRYGDREAFRRAGGISIKGMRPSSNGLWPQKI
jgi:hypothetical protein